MGLQCCLRRAGALTWATSLLGPLGHWHSLPTVSGTPALAARATSPITWLRAAGASVLQSSVTGQARAPEAPVVLEGS